MEGAEHGTDWCGLRRHTQPEHRWLTLLLAISGAAAAALPIALLWQDAARRFPPGWRLRNSQGTGEQAAAEWCWLEGRAGSPGRGRLARRTWICICDVKGVKSREHTFVEVSTFDVLSR